MTLTLVQSPALDRAAQIAALNDACRVNQTGSWLMTPGVRELVDQDIEARAALIKAIVGFDKFEEDDDPYGERDFGAFDFLKHRVFWKIDYYDRARENGSPDPADPAVTHRVITIMLSNEY